jgi:hypothetical protein
MRRTATLLLDDQAGNGKWKAKACSEEHQREEEKVSQAKRVNTEC